MKKTRIDRWDAELDEATRWRAYEVFSRSKYAVFLEWAKKQIPDTELPSRAALYAWAATMRKEETAHRLADARQAQLEAGQIAEAGGVEDETLQMALKGLAADIVLRTGNVKDAATLIQSAVSLRESGTRAEALRLAREKFEAAERRLKATEEAVRDLSQAGGLTPEARATIEKAMGIL